jgi:hypothetical protein
VVPTVRLASNVCFHAATKTEGSILTKRFAMELGPHNITVNAVAPGFVRTDMIAWPRRRRLAGDGICCKGNDGAHWRTRGHRQCRRVLGLTGVRLDHCTGVNRGRRANGLHRTRLEMRELARHSRAAFVELTSSDRRAVVAHRQVDNHPNWTSLGEPALNCLL